MDLQTRNRASRMERAFSWIAGAEFTVSSARPTNESNSQKSTKRTSRRSQTFHSFLTLHSRSKSDMPVRNSLTSGQGSVVDTLSVDEETMAPPKSIRLSFAADSSASSWSATRRLNATSPGNKSEQHVADARPPPFFYSYPIPPVPGFNAGSATPEDGDVSASSADSKEIMTWRGRPRKRESSETPHTPTPTARRGSRFGSFKSLWTPSLRGGSPSSLHLKKGPHLSPPTSATPDVSLALSAPIVPLSTPPTAYSHPSSTASLTLASRSHSRSSSIHSQGLLPPPRPKPKFSRESKTPKTPQTIDPAKWAEISISAAELVSRFGEGNVLFYPSPPSVSYEGNSFDLSSQASSFEEDRATSFEEGGGGGGRALENESFIEVEDECARLRPSIYMKGAMGDRARDKDLELDISRSSMMTGTESMVSFSKWPLPPLVDRFDITSAA